MVGWKKVKKKKKKKVVLFFSVRGEGNLEIDHKKKTFFLSPLGSFLTIFGG